MAKNKVYALIIQGLVQGVGFRPFIYRIAKDLGMKGCVENMNNGVRILVATTPDDRDLLISRIRTEHPRVAYIHRISYTSTEMDEDDLTILRLRPAIQNRMRSRRSPRISLFVRIVCETGLLNPIESDILLLIVRIVALVSLLSGTFLTTVRRQRWAVSLCVPIVRKNIRMLSIAVSMPNRSLAIIVARLITRLITRRLISIMRPY